MIIIASPALGPTSEQMLDVAMDPFDLDESTTTEWWNNGILPYGAVEFETVQERTLDSPLVQVTQVNSFDDIWICPNPWNLKDELLEEMNKFYIEGEGSHWTVPSTDYCRGRHLMSAPYGKVGYHRVLIKQILSLEIVNVLFIDYGTIQEINVSCLRLLHKKFLSPPAQAIPVRLWGIKENEEVLVSARSTLCQMMLEGNQFGFCCQIVSNIAKRRTNGVREQVPKPSVWLQDIHEENSVNMLLLYQNLADMDEFTIDNLKDVKYMDELQLDLVTVVQNSLRSWFAKLIEHSSENLESRVDVHDNPVSSDGNDEFQVPYTHKSVIDNVPKNFATNPRLVLDKEIVPVVARENKTQTKIIDIEDDDDEYEDECEIRFQQKIRVIRPKLIQSPKPLIVGDTKCINDQGSISVDSGTGTWDEDVSWRTSVRINCRFLRMAICTG